MSKFIEFAKLVPAGLKNLDKIVESYTNQVKMEFNMLNQEDVDIIVGRRLICSQCPFNSINAKESGLYTGDRTDFHCIQCGCPIHTKTASLEANCGLEIYNDKNPSNQIPLKWEKKTK